MADSVIGKAALVLTVNNAQLTAGLTSAGKTMSSFWKSTTSLMKALPVGSSGMLSSLENIKETALETIKVLAGQNKAAKKLGIETQSYQALTFAGSSVDPESFEKGLQKFSKSISNASMGSKEAIASFKQLGLSEKEIASLKELPLEEALKRVSDGFKTLPSADKVRLAMELFGKGGVEMIPFLNQGSQSIDKLIQKAKELGIALNPKDQNRVNEAAKAMKEVKLAWSGMANSLAVGLAPFFQIFASGMGKLVPAVSPIVKALAKIVTMFQVMSIGPAIAIASGALVVLLKALTPIVDMAWDFMEALGEVAGLIVDELTPVWDEFVNSIVNSEFVATVKEWWSSFVSWARDSLSKMGLDFSSWKNLILSALNRLSQGVSTLWDMFRVGAGFLLKWFVAPTITSISLVVSAIRGLIDLAAKLPDELGGDKFRGMQEGAAAMDDQVKKLGKTVGEAGQQWQDVKVGGNNQAIQDFFDKVKAKGGQAADALKDPKADPQHIMLLSEIDDINEKLIEQANTLGLTADQLKLYELRTRGATDADLALTEQLMTSNAIDAFNYKLEEQIATMGMTADEVKLYELALSGATDAQLEMTKELIDQKNGWEKHFQMMEEGKKLTEEMRTPLEKYQDTLARLDDMLASGAISYETYSRAVKKATDEMQKTPAKIELPAFEMKNTQEAVTTIIKARMQASGLGKVGDKAEQQRDKANEFLKVISTNTKPVKEAPPVIETV